MFQRRSIHTMSGAGQVHRRLGCSCHHRCTMSSRWRIGLLNPYGPRLGHSSSRWTPLTNSIVALSPAQGPSVYEAARLGEPTGRNPGGIPSSRDD